MQIGFSRAASTLRGITGLRIVFEARFWSKTTKSIPLPLELEVIFILD